MALWRENYWEKLSQELVFVWYRVQGCSLGLDCSVSRRSGDFFQTSQSHLGLGKVWLSVSLGLVLDWKPHISDPKVLCTLLTECIVCTWTDVAGVSCDSCMKGNFTGKRYKCLICYDYDLCSSCYEAGTSSSRHSPDHPMQCILTQADFGMLLCRIFSVAC